VEMGGKALRAGDTVRVGLGAANRDPQAFDDPDRFDIARRPRLPAAQDRPPPPPHEMSGSMVRPLSQSET